MSDTLRIVRDRGNGGTPRPRAKERRWGSGHSDPVARELASRIGRQPKTCEHLIRDVPRLAAAIIQAHQACQAELRLARWLEVIERARAGQPVLALSDLPARGLKLLIEAQQADSEEEVGDTWFDRDESDENLALLIRLTRRQLATTSMKLSALVAEQEKRAVMRERV